MSWCRSRTSDIEYVNLDEKILYLGCSAFRFVDPMEDAFERFLNPFFTSEISNKTLVDVHGDLHSVSLLELIGVEHPSNCSMDGTHFSYDSCTRSEKD